MRRISPLLLALVVGCGGGGTNQAEAIAQALIGPAGGEIRSSDGSLKLVIPAGALDAEIEIGIRKLSAAEIEAGTDLIGGGYELSPDGLTFASPVAVELAVPGLVEWSGDTLGVDTPLGILISPSSGTAELLGEFGIAIDGATRTARLTGTLSHFSFLFWAVGQVRESPTAPNDPGIRDKRFVKLDVTPEPGQIVTEGAFFQLRYAIRTEVNSLISVTHENKTPLTNSVVYSGEATRHLGQTADPSEVLEAVVDGYRCRSPGRGEYRGIAWVDPIQIEVDILGAILRRPLEGFESPIPVEISIDIDCAVANTDVTEGFADQPEGLARVPAGYFGLAGDAILVAEKNGFRLIDAADASLILKLNEPGRNFVESVATGTRDPASLPAGTNSILQSVYSVGGDGSFDIVWDPRFDEFTGASFGLGTYTDVSSYGGVANDVGLVVVNFSAQRIVPVEFDPPGLPPPPLSVLDIPGRSGGPVSAVRDGPNQPIFWIADGDPNGQLWRDGTKIGDLGASPRRIRALDRILAITNYGSDSLTVALRDLASGATTIEIVVPIGDGPIGVDLFPLGNGNLGILTTGSLGDTFSITEVNPADATLVSNRKFDLPPGSAGPGHGIFLAPDRVAISCKTSDRVLFLPVPPPP